MKPLNWFIASMAIVIIAAVLWPVTACGCSSGSPRNIFLSRIKQLGTGVQIYLADYDDVFPAAQDQATFHDALFPYVKNETMFHDPRDAEHQVRIAYNTRLANVKVKSLKSPEKSILLTTPYAESANKSPTHYLVGFADTSARSFPILTWQSDYADLLDRNYPRVSETFLPAGGSLSTPSDNPVVPERS